MIFCAWKMRTTFYKLLGNRLPVYLKMTCRMYHAIFHVQHAQTIMLPCCQRQKLPCVWSALHAWACAHLYNVLIHVLYRLILCACVNAVNWLSVICYLYWLTVVWVIFAVKIFSWVALCAKIKRAEFSFFTATAYLSWKLLDSLSQTRTSLTTAY